MKGEPPEGFLPRGTNPAFVLLDVKAVARFETRGSADGKAVPPLRSCLAGRAC